MFKILITYYFMIDIYKSIRLLKIKKDIVTNLLKCSCG